jgi:hypothetical protein
MTESNKAPACKVVSQYHSGGERVYELAIAGSSLELRISSRASGGGERIWHVQAQQGDALDSESITEQGETKRGALTKVAAQWAERAGELGLPIFDWAAVETALLAVRGI